MTTVLYFLPKKQAFYRTQEKEIQVNEALLHFVTKIPNKESSITQQATQLKAR